MTPQETTFIGAFARTGDRAYAAEKADYAQPTRDAGRALARPAVQVEIVRQQVARLNNELLPLAIGVLFDVLTNKASTERGKLAAAAQVIKATIGMPMDAAQGKEPHEMSSAELQQRIGELRREASERAKPIIDVEAADPTESSVFD